MDQLHCCEIRKVYDDATDDNDDDKDNNNNYYYPYYWGTRWRSWLNH